MSNTRLFLKSLNLIIEGFFYFSPPKKGGEEMSADMDSSECYNLAWSNKNISMRRKAVDELSRRAEGNSTARDYLTRLANKDRSNKWEDNEIIGRARSYLKT